MPNEAQIPQIPAVNLDDGPLKLGLDAIKESYALQLVTETFNNYENYRSQNHDPRWNSADTLYFGWLPGKVWEGTTVPRSALGVPMVFDQVEAALPAISQEIFVPQDEWFQVETEPGTDIKEARQVQEHLSYVLEHSKNDYGLSAKNEIELAIKSDLLYGNGGVEIYWDSVLNRPVVSWVDTRDFYVDPGCPVPNIDEARSIVRRKFFTVQDLISMREDPRMNIPSDEVLYTMSKNPMYTIADQTKSNQEAIRGVAYAPNVTDYSPNPADRKIECLLYYSKTKIIWVLNRALAIYNEKNPYGFIPFCFAPCYTVPGRFYAQSISDVQEGNQRYVEALVNARLDALSLDLMPPRVYKKGQLMTPSQLRWRPGATYQADDAKDVALLQSSNPIANIFTDVQYIQDNAEKRTGINSMQSGIPQASNTNRTATGVQAISSGAMSRLRYLVSNIENYLIVPMLYKLYTLVQMHNRPDSNLTGISKEGELTQVSTNAFQGKMRFRMLASSKMLTREKLAQIFPFLTQYMFNGTFLQGIQSTGQTLDFGEFFKMLQDATGTGRLYNFVRPLTQQEQQAKQTPPPEVQMQAQQKQQELQTRLQIAQGKNQTDLQKAQIASQLNPQELQQDQQRFAMEQDRENARMHSEQIMQAVKLQAEREKHQMEMHAKQQELQGKQAEIGLNLQGKQMEHAINLQQMQQQGDMERNQSFADHALGLQQSTDEHKQKLENMKSAGKIQEQQARKKAEIKKKTVTKSSK